MATGAIDPSQLPPGPLLGVPRPPVVVDRAFEDPDAIRALVAQHAPYWPVLRYAVGANELKAVGGAAHGITVPPWFRGDWAYGEPLVEGAERVLGNPAFRDAAAQLFGAAVVRPQIVYVNVMAPMASSGPPHVDVPAFRGIDRREFPVWLLHVMHRSGLFARWKIDIATAVAWFYEGEGGEFEYWAEGAGAAPRRVVAPLSNRAVVGDNDVMFHRVATIGAAGARQPDRASLSAELLPDAADPAVWRVVDGDRECIRYVERDLRVSVSWKAECFPDEATARVADEHVDDLDLETVVERFLEAARQSGVPLDRPADPLHEPSFVEALSALYPIPAPSV